MCGIVGWVDWQRDLNRESQTLDRMTATLAPRGPDAEGIWTAERAAFGHRRLAVIDIAGGAQPMVVPGGGGRPVALTYSGEVYNFGELRHTLRGKGHRFTTESDTEVVLRSYVEWGERCVDRFNGIFAFAIWDDAEQQLFLARDRLGVKPLYYSVYPGGLLFASEVKALLAHPVLSAQVDAEGLAELLSLNQTPGHAVFRGINSLRPGTTIKFDRRGCRAHTYWRLESKAHSDSFSNTAAAVRDLLDNTVEMQLVSDVALGSLLSGGLDSSVLTAFASRTLARKSMSPLPTYDIDHQNSEEYFEPSIWRHDLDRPFARMMAQHAGTEHHEITLDTADIFTTQHEIMVAKDIPGFGAALASLHVLFKRVRQDCTVVLSGEAADEVFGGYAYFHHDHLINRAALPWAPPPEIIDVLSRQFQDHVQPQKYVDGRYHEALAEVPTLSGETRSEARIRELSYLSLTRFVPILLDNKDRLSMSTGLEVRVPYCDHRLVQYVWDLPWAMKSHAGQPKGLLREATRGLLPEQITNRRKSGFPTAVDPAYQAQLRVRLEDEFNTANSPLTSILDREKALLMLDKDSPEQGVWRALDALSYLLQIADWIRTYRVEVI